MSVKAALYDYLSAYSGLSDATFFHDVADDPATDMPYVIITFVSSDHVRDLRSASGFAMRRVQFDVYAKTAGTVDTIAEQIRQALEGFRGTIGDDNVDILSSGLESERDDYIDPDDGGQVGRHRRSVDYMIWHSISVPTFS